VNVGRMMTVTAIVLLVLFWTMVETGMFMHGD